MEVWAQRPFESLRQVPYPTAYCLLDEIIAICQNALELHVANIDPVNITATAMIRVVEAMIAATCTDMCSVSSISLQQTINDNRTIPLLNAKDGYCILNRLLPKPCSIHAPTLSASLMQQQPTSCDLSSELDDDSVAWGIDSTQSNNPTFVVRNSGESRKRRFSISSSKLRNNQTVDSQSVTQGSQRLGMINLRRASALRENNHEQLDHKRRNSVKMGLRSSTEQDNSAIVTTPR